ncbi:MAG: electron transport complex subunit E [Clostridia bacterium]|nr:electron transport complex subunit E [Clostridia bacterium]
MKSKKLGILTNGVVKSNPTFRLVLGTCPTLAVTTQAINGLAMGAAVTFVLLCSNVMISLLKNVIPDRVRIPAYVVIIATFVTVVQMVMQKFLPSLYDALGVFLPLIVVNCIILARAEAFASCNPVLDSALDGIGMGFGFTLSLTFIGIVRELLGAGSFFNLPIGSLGNVSMTVFILPAGGFLVYGTLMALVNFLTRLAENRKYEKTERAASPEKEA